MVTWSAPTATDDLDGSLPVGCAPDTGSVFPLGTTAVTCTAADTAGNAGMVTFSVTVTLATPPSTLLLRDFVAYSQEHTWIQKGTTVQSGDVGANGQRNLPPHARKDKKEEVRIGERVQFAAGSKIVGDTIWLQKLAQVFDLFFNELRNNGASILGMQNSPLTVPVLARPPVPTVTPGTQDVTVEKNQTVTLAAGAYRTIKVEKGGTLKLSGGVYQVASVNLRQDVKVLWQAAGELQVQNEFDTDKGTYFGPDPAVAGLRAKDINVVVMGSDDRGRRHDDDDSNDVELTPTVVQFGHHNVVQANVYAPHGTVWVKHHSQATGAFIGQRVRIGHDTMLSLDSGF